MPHPLERKIDTLRTRVRRLVAVHGVSWVIAAVLATVIVAGLADYLIRFQDPGLRVICSSAVLAALGWTSYRYLYLPLESELHVPFEEVIETTAHLMLLVGGIVALKYRKGAS